ATLGKRIPRRRVDGALGIPPTAVVARATWRAGGRCAATLWEWGLLGSWPVRTVWSWWGHVSSGHQASWPAVETDAVTRHASRPPTMGSHASTGLRTHRAARRRKWDVASCVSGIGRGDG